jgi:hypothetical protein
MGAAVPLRLLAASDNFEEARELFEGLPDFLRSAEAMDMNHSDMERELEKRGRELMRKLYQGWLDQVSGGEVDGPVRDTDGQERTRQRQQARGLETVFGSVEVERTGHGAQGEASLHPLDGHLNLPEERYSHELRRRAAEEASKNSFDETVNTLERYTGTRIPKRQVEELVVRAAQDFDAFYEARRRDTETPDTETPDTETPDTETPDTETPDTETPDTETPDTETPDTEKEGSVLVITADGKGVVLRKEDLRPATRRAAERRRNKMTTRLSKGEKKNRKRMATVAAVYTIEPYVRTPQQVQRALARVEIEGSEKLPRRPRPENKRVWASLEQEPVEVIEEAFQEALRRDPDRKKSWVSVVDGNEHQLDILEGLAEKHGVQLTIILDIVHVLEYLWKAGHVFEAEGSYELEHWVLERLGRILEGRACQVAAAMRRSATMRNLSKSQRAPVDTCADYLLKYKDYLAYDQYLAAGFPVGSGVIEGACRHLVKDRMDLTGARWRLSGAEAVLRLRALRSSHDFEEYWRFHEARELDRNHRARYADGVVPPLNFGRGKPPKLRRIK